MYTQMKAEPDISPDLITFSVLIKANCDNDHLEDALQLLDEMLTFGFRPDEVVFNNLMAGCARHGNAKLGKQLYDDMVKSGLRPSNATFSILIRLYHQSKLLEDAVTLLKTEPAKHNVEPEDRLFVQLIQSCIRERQGRRAVEVYEMLSKRSTPNATTHSGMLGTCMRLNMFDTAGEMLNKAVANGGRVDSCDTNSLLEAAVKKGKVQAARNCIASMHALYHNVDGKFIDFVEKNSSPAQLTSGHSGGDDHSFATSIQRPAPSSVPPWRGMA
jgi:pentatricopeptide repeat protein